jgi:competence protein ComEA
MNKYLLTLILGMFSLFASGLFTPAQAQRLQEAKDAVAQSPKAPKSTTVKDAASPSPSPGGVVNINDASPDQLEFLPGIGPSRARAIVEHRKAHPFKRVEDLTRIKGIGKKTFARLRPMIALSGATTLSERPSRR